MIRKVGGPRRLVCCYHVRMYIIIEWERRYRRKWICGVSKTSWPTWDSKVRFIIFLLFIFTYVDISWGDFGMLVFIGVWFVLCPKKPLPLPVLWKDFRKLLEKGLTIFFPLLLLFFAWKIQRKSFCDVEISF